MFRRRHSRASAVRRLKPGALHRGSLKLPQAWLPGRSRKRTFRNLGRLFFPQARALGIQVDEDLSPTLIEKTVQLGTMLRSFPQARIASQSLLDVRLTTKRIERLTERIGQERVAERDAQVRTWQSLPLVEKLVAPPGVKPPDVVAVSCDGGRLQRCDLPAERDSNWCEYKAGTLSQLKAVTQANDPCPEIPAVFLNPTRIDTLAREIGHVAAEPADLSVPPPQSAATAETASAPVTSPRASAPLPDEMASESVYVPPQVLSRDVCATLGDSHQFGHILAAVAWSLGFAAARLKAFVADGLPWNWTIWDKHFKHLRFVPILDFIHALTYVYAAALADRRHDQGWPIYTRWIRWIWEGQVLTVIAELAERQKELGLPPDDASETDPRQIVSAALTYLQNQQSRMNYPEYRKQGLPITSSHMESTIKQLNERIKGSEKFWCGRGGEAVLQLRADMLSNSQPLSAFWAGRADAATGTRTYDMAA